MITVPCPGHVFPLQVFLPATPVAALLLAAAPHAPMWWNVWSSTFLMLICLSQQFHAWSHMKRSELPAAVVALQVRARGLLGRAGQVCVPREVHVG